MPRLYLNHVTLASVAARDGSMMARKRAVVVSPSFLAITTVVVISLTSLVIWPHIDLAVSALFYEPKEGFVWREFLPFNVLAWLARYGSRVLGVLLVVAALVTASRRRPLLKLSSKAWLFLFLGLLLGPGLVANLVFKDNWGRARPRDVIEFGGTAQFSPAFYMRKECEKNCSFISGDASFGFYLPSYAYVVPPRHRRRVFWNALRVGSLFAVARLIIGAHFLSDVLYAGFFMFLTIAVLHGVMFGWRKTKEFWREMLKECVYKTQ